MLDDLIGQLLGEAVSRRLGQSKRTQVLARLFFGLIGTVLGAIGTVHFLRRPLPSNVAMHASMVMVFVFLSCFSLFNVALFRPWRWPGLALLASLVSIFVTRIAFGI
jgi:hypothetical protein